MSASQYLQCKKQFANLQYSSYFFFYTNEIYVVHIVSTSDTESQFHLPKTFVANLVIHVHIFKQPEASH